MPSNLSIGRPISTAECLGVQGGKSHSSQEVFDNAKWAFYQGAFLGVLYSFFSKHTHVMANTFSLGCFFSGASLMFSWLDEAI